VVNIKKKVIGSWNVNNTNNLLKQSFSTLMYENLHVRSYICLYLGNLGTVSSSDANCPLDDVSRLLILSSNALMASTDDSARFP
jgi:hypothetical protein